LATLSLLKEDCMMVRLLKKIHAAKEKGHFAFSEKVECPLVFTREETQETQAKEKGCSQVCQSASR